MRRPQLMLLSITILALAATAMAQDDEITVNSNVSPNQIKEWLEGDDPFLTAWGAYFASMRDDANNDDAYVTIMARKMARWNPSRETWYATLAMSEILYALIEKNEHVPVVSLTPMMSVFPTQTLILAARVPAEDAAPLLQDWYEKRIPLQTSIESGNRIKATPFAYVAGMLLAKAPPPGIAASVLAESGERLSFWIADGMYEKSKWTGGSGTITCMSGDQAIDPPPLQFQDELSKWPPRFQYQLQSDSSPYGGTLLVDVGGERINYRRLSASIRPTQCYFPDVFSDELSHRMVAEMLGVKDQEMPWPSHQDFICIEECKKDFPAALRKRIHLEESKLIATVEVLRAKGYLTQSEADAVRPKLSVIVNDARVTEFMNGQDHEPPPLPRFAPADPRSSISYDKR